MIMIMIIFMHHKKYKNKNLNNNINSKKFSQKIIYFKKNLIKNSIRGKLLY